MVNRLVPGRCLNYAVVPALLTYFVPGHFGRDGGLARNDGIHTTTPGAGIPDIIPGSSANNCFFS